MFSGRQTGRPGAGRQVELGDRGGARLEVLPFPSATLHANATQAASTILSELEGGVDGINRGRGWGEGENLCHSKRFSEKRKLSRERWECSEVMESVSAKGSVTKYRCFRRFFQKCGQSALFTDPISANSSTHQNVFVTPKSIPTVLSLSCMGTPRWAPIFIAPMHAPAPCLSAQTVARVSSVVF